MQELDDSRPYSEILGVVGVRFEQDGRYFNNAHHQVDWGGNIIAYATVAPENDTIDPPPVASGQTDAPTGSLSALHWRHLKAMVESYGGEWTNKVDAIRFLSGDR